MINKRKILFITHSYAMTGGAEDDFERLLNYFSQKKQYEVHCLCPKGARADIYSRYCYKFGYYKYGHLPAYYDNLWAYAKYMIKAFFQIFQIIKFAYKEHYDLTVINVVVLLWPALTMKIMGSKVIVFIRENVYPVKVRHILYKILSAACNFFIPNSISKETEFINVTGNRKVQHIYPAIGNSSGTDNTIKDDLPEGSKMLSDKSNQGSVFPELIYQKLNDRGVFKFLSSGRIMKLKNQILILKALNIIKKLTPEGQMPYVFFLGYYDVHSDYMMQIKRYITENTLEEYCFFLGEILKEYVPEIYKKTDSTIISSLTEGMPIVLVESFKYKRPVISTKVGGIPEIIENKKNGLLIDNEEDMLANAMITLMKNPELYTNISKNALETYYEKFNLENALNETENIFLNVINVNNK